jgi:hypothetical protein
MQSRIASLFAGSALIAGMLTAAAVGRRGARWPPCLRRVRCRWRGW